MILKYKILTSFRKKKVKLEYIEHSDMSCWASHSELLGFRPAAAAVGLVLELMLDLLVMRHTLLPQQKGFLKEVDQRHSEFYALVIAPHIAA